MLTKVWLMFCVVWAGFSLVWGPLTGPDTWRDRFAYAAVPLIIGVVLMPILRGLNFRKAYRIGGWGTVCCLIVVWFFVLALFLGPGIALELGYPGVRDKLIWVLAFFCGILPAFLLSWWLFIKLPFMVLRWLARALFPELFSADSRYTRLPEP